MWQYLVSGPRLLPTTLPCPLTGLAIHSGGSKCSGMVTVILISSFYPQTWLARCGGGLWLLRLPGLVHLSPPGATRGPGEGAWGSVEIEGITHCFQLGRVSYPVPATATLHHGPCLVTSCGDGRLLLHHLTGGRRGEVVEEQVGAVGRDEVGGGGCGLCGAGANSAEHFFLECPALARPRGDLLQVGLACTSLKLDLVLVLVPINLTWLLRPWRGRCRGSGGPPGSGSWRSPVTWPPHLMST